VPSAILLHTATIHYLVPDDVERRAECCRTIDGNRGSEDKVCSSMHKQQWKLRKEIQPIMAAEVAVAQRSLDD
jgi:hypothetical protein